jgi:hypothetical protein
MPFADTKIDASTKARVSRIHRGARWGAIAFVVLGIGGFFGAGDGGYDDGAKIAAYFAEHRARILLGYHAAAIGMSAFVVWAWWVMKRLEAKGDDERLGVAVLVAAATTAAVELGVIALAMTLALISSRAVDPGLALAFANAYQVFSCIDFFPLALFFLAFGLAALRTRLVSAWLAWTAIVLVPLSLLSAAPSLGLDAPVSLLVFAWLFVVSVSLIRSDASA